MGVWYFSKLVYEKGEFYFAIQDDAVKYVGPLNAGINELKEWAKKNMAELIENSSKTVIIAEQLSEYLKGNREIFSLKLDPNGTPFQKSVWNELLKIPYAQSTNYLTIAKQINNPKAMRAVGTAIGKNPIAIIVPCHRVLGSKKTLNGYRGGLAAKEQLLLLEKIEYKKE